MASSAPRRNARPLVLAVIMGLVILVVLIDVRRRQAETQLAELTTIIGQSAGQNGGTEKSRAEAQAIVEKVRKLIDIPESPEPTVATIVDVDALREKNPFYEKATNGDNLILTGDRAILYSATKNIIIDVVPVQMESVSSASAATKPVSKTASSK